jgi:hypothetical protein
MAISHKLLSISLAGVCGLAIVGCFGGDTKTVISPLKQREMEESIYFFEGNLYSLWDAGYVAWTPTTAAAELVTIMNTSMTLTPEEEEEYRQQGMRIHEPISYVLNEPTDRWQIVLVPDDEQQVIHVRGYGPDLETPILEQEFPCCGY